jgi:hypothetical protein
MRPAKILTFAVPLVALAISGCGGGGDDSTSTAATTEPVALSKAELISQGDAICGEVNAAAGAAELVAAEGEEGALKAKVSSLYIGMVESLERLGAPDEDAGYAELVAAADELSKVEGEVKLAAEREDSAALDEATTAAATAREEFESVAGEYGFEDCSEGPNAPTAPGTGAAGGAPEEVEEGGLEVAPEEFEEEAPVEEVVPEEAAPETGGAGGGVEEAAPEAGGETGGSSGGVGPG